MFNKPCSSSAAAHGRTMINELGAQQGVERRGVPVRLRCLLVPGECVGHHAELDAGPAGRRGLLNGATKRPLLSRYQNECRQRESDAGGVKASVDVHDLARSPREPVRQQRHARRATASVSRTSHPSGARPSHTLSNVSKPGIDLAASVRTGPAATRLARGCHSGRGRGRGSGRAIPAPPSRLPSSRIRPRRRWHRSRSPRSTLRRRPGSAGSERCREDLQRVGRHLEGRRHVGPIGEEHALPGRFPARSRWGGRLERPPFSLELRRHVLSLARDRDIELVDLGRGGKLAGHAVIGRGRGRTR